MNWLLVILLAITVAGSFVSLVFRISELRH
jgi:hypothetical protein